MSLDIKYAYVLPKAFSLKASLLSRQKIYELARMNNLEEFVSSLNILEGYKGCFNDIKNLSATSIERKLILKLIETERKFIEWSPREESLFLSVFFRRHEITNMKAMIHGRISGLSLREINRYIIVEVEQVLGHEDIIKRLRSIGKEEITFVLRELGYPVNLGEVLPRILETGDYYLIDAYLNRGFLHILQDNIGKLSEPNRGLCHYVFSVLIDMHNVINILRGKLWQLSTEEILDLIVEPKVGVINYEHLMKMINEKSLSSCINLLKDTQYHHISKKRKIEDIEKEFRKFYYLRAEELFKGNMFSIGPLLGSIMLREREIKTLIAIAYGIERKLPFEILKEELLV